MIQVQRIVDVEQIPMQVGPEVLGLEPFQLFLKWGYLLHGWQPAPLEN